MESRFEHEINITKYFIEELETYLKQDQIKAREAAESQILDMQISHGKEIDELHQELKETQLKLAIAGVERGKLMKEVDFLIDKMRGETIAEPDATGRQR